MKLVRDRIGDISWWPEQGKQHFGWIAPHSDGYRVLLRNKLIEEVGELLNADGSGDPHAVLEETADVFEVLRALLVAVYPGVTPATARQVLANAVDRKFAERGGFFQGRTWSGPEATRCTCPVDPDGPERGDPLSTCPIHGWVVDDDERQARSVYGLGVPEGGFRRAREAAEKLPTVGQWSAGNAPTAGPASTESVQDGSAVGEDAPNAPGGAQAVPERAQWTHGSRLGREHTSVRQHLIEDHGEDPAEVERWSDGAVHGAHDGAHGCTWAYAKNLPHRYSLKFQGHATRFENRDKPSPKISNHAGKSSDHTTEFENEAESERVGGEARCGCGCGKPAFIGPARPPLADEESLTDAVVAAALAWRARIRDDPRHWADDQDFALIEAVDAYRAAGETTTVVLDNSTATFTPKRYDGTCPRCGSPDWVAVSFTRGLTRFPQCVPCGQVHPTRLGPNDEDTRLTERGWEAVELYREWGRL